MLLSASALAAPGMAHSASAADGTFEPGSGRARSNVFEVVPRTGGLTIPFSFGRALTQYQGTRAEATSTVGSFPFNPTKPPSEPPPGFPGGSSATGTEPAADEGECGSKNPGGNGGGSKPPSTKSPFAFDLKTTSDEPDSVKGKSESYMENPPGSPIVGYMSKRQVSATKAPFGTAISTSGMMGIPGVAEIKGGRAEARSGVVDGKTRLADGTVTMQQVELLGGQVKIEDMLWHATQKTGEGEANSGSFTVGRVTVAGQQLPAAPDGGDPFGPLNEAIAQSGFSIESPKFEAVNGVARVSPMSLRVNDSPFGREYIGPTVANLQPVRDPLVAAFLSYSCDAGLAVTVADVALSGASGSGGISFDFGGVTATTEGAVFDNPFDDVEGAFGDPFGATPPGGDVPGPSDVPFASAPAYTLPPVGAPGPVRYASQAPLPASSELPDVPPPLPAGHEEVASPVPQTYIQPALGSSTRQIPGKRGGNALWVALAGLAAVAGLAGADVAFTRRKGA